MHSESEPDGEGRAASRDALDRLAIFIDGANFNKAVRDGLGVRVDYGRLLSTLCVDRATGFRRRLLRAYYYAGEWSEKTLYDIRQLNLNGGCSISEKEYEDRRFQQHGFFRMLSRSGYTVRKKPIKIFGDNNLKANLDIEMALDMLKAARHVHTMVVATGDGDFVPAIEEVQSLGVRVEVLGTAEEWLLVNGTRVRFPGRAAEELIDCADAFIDLKAIQKDFSRTADARQEKESSHG